MNLDHLANKTVTLTLASGAIIQGLLPSISVNGNWNLYRRGDNVTVCINPNLVESAVEGDWDQ